MSEPKKTVRHGVNMITEVRCCSPYFALQSRNVTHGRAVGKLNKAPKIGSDGGPGGRRARLRCPEIKE